MNTIDYVLASGEFYFHWFQHFEMFGIPGSPKEGPVFGVLPINFLLPNLLILVAQLFFNVRHLNMGSYGRFKYVFQRFTLGS